MNVARLMKIEDMDTIAGMETVGRATALRDSPYTQITRKLIESHVARFLSYGLDQTPAVVIMHPLAPSPDGMHA